MKIAVGLSGGVDSAVSALLLKEQGHEVIGVFMKNWSDDFGIYGECPWEVDQNDAYEVSKYLGIEFLTYNFEKEYRDKVVEYFFHEYRKGRTPNPDVLCNIEIKFNLFLKKCIDELGVDKIATGHYAKVLQDKEKFSLLKGKDLNKDQSYFLCRLTQFELSKSIFPLGNLRKDEVRRIALDKNLPVAKKKDSQGICFIGKINVRDFIKGELGEKKGDIVDKDTGKVLGEHKGIWFHTPGQRQGLGLGGGPWFVVDKDSDSNIVYVVKGDDNPLLFTHNVLIDEFNVINEDEFSGVVNNTSKEVEVKLRYRQKPAYALLSKFNNQIKIIFKESQRTPAPGQFACIYYGEEVIASGVIV